MSTVVEAPSWRSRYSAKFTKPVIRQLIAFIQRDQRAALDDVGGTVNPLADFVKYQLSPAAIPQCPAVLVSPGPTVFERETAGCLEYTTSIFAVVAVENQ